MTAPTQGTGGTVVPPADEAITGASGSALNATDADPIDHGMFVPPPTRDNYLTMIRDQAAIRGVDPGTVRDELVEQFRDLHSRQPLDGYDHLAGWLASADIGAGTGPTGLQVLNARILESARRDPFQAAIGDQAAVEQAVTAQVAADEAVAAAAVAPSVDPSSGMLPNPGPLPVPADVTTVDPAVAEQQQAAAAQLAGEDAPPPSTDTTSSSGSGGTAGGTGGTSGSTDTAASSTTDTSSSSSSSKKSGGSGGE
jgi:cobalamin biosynthesis Mg chelatase CobN